MPRGKKNTAHPEGFNWQYQTEILRRFLNKTDMQSLHDSYIQNAYTGRTATPPTEVQFEIAKAYKKGKKNGVDIKTIAKEFAITTQQVDYAFRRVATYEYFNS